MSKNNAPSKNPRPNQIDIIIGQNLKLIRVNSGLSQAALADRIGITFQQVQKYEHGTNRVSASTLYTISKILDVTIMDFYEDIETDSDLTASSLRTVKQDIHITELFQKIKNPLVRHKVLDLLKIMTNP